MTEAVALGELLHEDNIFCLYTSAVLCCVKLATALVVLA